MSVKYCSDQLDRLSPTRGLFFLVFGKVCPTCGVPSEHAPIVEVDVERSEPPSCSCFSVMNTGNLAMKVLQAFATLETLAGICTTARDTSKLYPLRYFPAIQVLLSGDVRHVDAVPALGVHLIKWLVHEVFCSPSMPQNIVSMVNARMETVDRLERRLPAHNVCREAIYLAFKYHTFARLLARADPVGDEVESLSPSGDVDGLLNPIELPIPVVPLAAVSRDDETGPAC